MYNHNEKCRQNLLEGLDCESTKEVVFELKAKVKEAEANLDAKLEELSPEVNLDL